MTAFVAAAQAITSRFQSEFHAVETDVPIAFDNVDVLYQSDGSTVDRSEDSNGNPEPWVRFSIRPGDSVLVGVSPRIYRQPGVAMTQIFVPVGDGIKRANEIAEVVATALRGQEDTGVRFGATSAPQWVAPDGSWTQFNVLTRFEYDEQQ